MNKKLKSKKILIYAKKLKAINILGGECKKCAEKDFFKLSFHHNNCKDKDNLISELLHSGLKWELIENELKKCTLFCNNCHNEYHFDNEINKDISVKKKIFLEYKNSKGCVECGYNKCNSSLHFHHKEKNNKNFILSDINIISKRIKNNNIYELTEDISLELDKCIILCSNCHCKKHSDILFFEEHKNEIIEKSLHLKYKQPKLDIKIIEKMYFVEKKKQIEIARFFNSSKGTISDIIKKISIKYNN
jgi:hypothetical protein